MSGATDNASDGSWKAGINHNPLIVTGRIENIEQLDRRCIVHGHVCRNRSGYGEAINVRQVQE